MGWSAAAGPGKGSGNGPTGPQRWQRWVLLAAVVLGTGSGGLLPLPVRLGIPAAQAQATAPVPPEVLNPVTQLEQAANRRDLGAVLNLLSPEFSHGDGFNRSQYGETLAAVWATYPDLQYRVRILSWQATSEGFSVETETTMTGTQTQGSRSLALTATVRSRQQIVAGQFRSQTILAEEAQTVVGTAPTLTVRLPETAPPGSRFNFDAIVREPLGNRILLGQALDEGVTAQDWLTPRPITLRSLNTGGLFKTGQAPANPDQRWISAVLVGDRGLVIHTRRLRVTN